MLYRCTLSASGFDDFIAPMRNFQLRLVQDPAPCSIIAVLAVAPDLWATITAMIHGTIKITQIDSAGTETDLLTVDIDTIRLDEGARRRTATVIGYRSIAFSTPATRTVPHATYNGSFQARARPMADLVPGDTALVAGESIVAAKIYWTVSTSRQSMEIVP